jgi:hypothetical protein
MLVTSKANTKNARLSTNHLDTSLILRYIFAFPCREHTHGQNGGSVNIAEEYARRKVQIRISPCGRSNLQARRAKSSCYEVRDCRIESNSVFHRMYDTTRECALRGALQRLPIAFSQPLPLLLVNIQSDELDNTGFTDMEDALKKLRSLQRAWRDHIRMVLQCYKSKGKIILIRMTFYMRGFGWSEEEYLRGFKTRTQNEN